MANERIIRIQIDNSEDDDSTNASDSENKISKPMEQLTLKQGKPNIQVKSKPNIQEECLKEFENFEEHIECSLPSTNVPEKIILVIDRAQDEKITPFILHNKSFTPFSMLKRAVQIFIKLKHMINKNHEFAVVILNTNTVGWYLNFSNDIRRINSLLDKLGECEVEETFKLNSLFDEIFQNVELPDVRDNVSPPYLVRTILCYGRSYTVPALEFSEGIKKNLQHPYFVCDILMTHEPVDKDNHCKQIFDILQNVDKKGYSYFLPVGRDTRRLHTYIAKLLAHPFQRPHQKLQKV